MSGPVDWDTLAIALPGAPDVAALATGLETDVPVVLLPVRVETRFDVIEVPDTADPGRTLIEALGALHDVVHRLAGRNYGTTLQGTVKGKKRFKEDVEQALYADVEADIEAAGTQLAAVRLVLLQPLTSGSPTLTGTLTALVAAIDDDLGNARAALTALRSPYQRERLTARFAAFADQVLPALSPVGSRIVPALRLAADLELRPAAQVARSIGRTPAGKPLRADLAPRPAVTPPLAAALVVLADGTPAAALGATRVIALDQARVADTAAAVETIKAGLAGGDVDLLAAAAAITVLPAAWKTDLLAAVDAVPGAERLHDAIAAVPSGRADLDRQVPDHLRGVVFELPGPTRLEHRLQVRVYPEPLAVDTHEPELTESEASAALRYWTEALAAGADRARALGAWRALCVGRRTRRAAWIAHVTEPPDVAPTPGAVAAADLRAQVDVLAKRLGELGRMAAPSPVRLVAGVDKAIGVLARAVAAAPALPPAAKEGLAAQIDVLRSALAKLSDDGTLAATDWARTLANLREAVGALADEPPPKPALPAVAPRASSWTRAASSRVLPDRFAVVTVSDGRVTHVAQGAPVPPDLALSLDPSAPAGSFTLDVDGNLVVDPSIRWLVDLDEAIARGMAISVPITAAESQSPFDELFVIGLSGGDAEDGASRIAAMLDAHHYTANGLALLPVGTPTNNTETQAAGNTSTDDADLAFDVERGTSLVADSGADGAVLAAALGIESGHLAHIAGADGRDAADSRVATTALYGATIGHAIEELAGGLISLDGRERLRTFVTGALSGRGLLPAIRVTDEPYGVLPVTALGRFVPDARDALGESADDHERARQALFDRVLLGVLQQMHADWTRLRAAVKHAHSPDVGAPGYDAQQYFLAMLGLQATSVSAAYRFSVNVADRGGVRHHPELSLSFGIPKPGGSTDSSAQYGPFALMERFAEPLSVAFGIADTVLRGPVVDGAGVSDHWRSTYSKLTSARAYTLRQLRGTKPLVGVLAGAPTALTALLAADYDVLVGQAREHTPDGTPLAEMLVRHALLVEARRAAVGILFTEQLADDAAFARAEASTTYDWTTLLANVPVSSWGFLLADLSELDFRYGISYAGNPFAQYLGAHSMAEYLAGRGTSPLVAGYAGRAAHEPALAALVAHADAVTALAALPPTRIDALVREHLDLGGHRLDAWLTGVAQRRLDGLRRAKPSGVRVGAFGWVENLQPDTTAPAAAVLPASLAGRPGRPVVSDPASPGVLGGFVHTPSPSHAVTAAILRGGYTSQANEGSLGNEMSINLGSGRVRTALSLTEGVRAGNDLGALLGYRLERFLHEYYARPDTPHVTELDQLIAPMRRAFPTVATVDPAADAGPERERYVVDGLALIRTVLDWMATQPDLAAAPGTLYGVLAAGTFGSYPWGLPTAAVPPAAQVDQVDGLLRALDDLANAIDGLADLTTAEAVHQIVRGNHARAAAVLHAMADGTAPPAAEIAQSPQSGLPVTHRLVLQIDPSGDGWGGVPQTPRASLEPAVDAWLAALLGDPRMIRVRVRPRSDSAADPADVGGPVSEVSVADLGLCPLDLLAMLGPGFEAGLGELIAHVLDHGRPSNIEPDQPGLPVPDPRDDYAIDPARAPAWGPGVRSIADVSALLESAADLLGKSRPATAADYTAEGAAPTVATDAADAAARIVAVREQARDAALDLARLLAQDATLAAAVLDGDPRAFVVTHDDVHLRDDPELGRVLAAPDGFWAARETWRDAVVAAARFGVRCAPPRRYASRAQVCKELLQAAETGFVELTTRVQAAVAADVLATPAAARLTAVAQALFGESVVVAPLLDMDVVRADVAASLAARLASPAEIDAWLEGVAAVRDPARHLSEVLLLGGLDLVAGVAQLPYTADEPWLGDALSDPAALSGRVSVALYGAALLPAEGERGVGLVLDEWTEVIPFREQTTGVALHYDQPDATAPQCVLVVVPPDRGRPWQLADLVASLHDTLEIARNRTVEPEHLGGDLYGQVLPLMVGEIVPEAAGASAPSGGRVILDFAQNNPGGN